MQSALLIYESQEAWAARNKEVTDPYIGAWRSYYKALVDAGIQFCRLTLRPRYGIKVTIEKRETM